MKRSAPKVKVAVSNPSGLTTYDKIYDDLGKHYNAEQEKDNHRVRLAQVFAWGYFLILIFSVLAVMIYNIAIYKQTKAENLLVPIKDVFIVVNSSVGSLLGFVIGYYFKHKE